MPQFDSEPDASVAVYRMAVEQMLMHFHHMDLGEARRRVILWSQRLSPATILHREPYMTAAALAGEPIEKTNERVEADGLEAEKIWEAAITAHDAALAAASKSGAPRRIIVGSGKASDVHVVAASGIAPLSASVSDVPVVGSAGIGRAIIGPSSGAAIQPPESAKARDGKGFVSPKSPKRGVKSATKTSAKSQHVGVKR